MPDDKKRDPMPSPDATSEEIGEFWDTHSLADYWDETHGVEVQVNLKPHKRENKMKNTIRFGDFVEVNPRIRLEKGKEYPYIEMADVNPGAEARGFNPVIPFLPALRLVWKMVRLPDADTQVMNLN